MTLLLALAVLQDPPPSLAELLLRFQDDSIEVREKAGERIIALGESALPALKKALEDEPNAEVRGRIRGAVARIEADQHRREFKGGKPVNGLGASLEGGLTPERTEFALKVTIINLDTRPRDFVLIERWSQQLPNLSSRSSSAEATVAIRQLTGQRGTRYGMSLG